jgi:hypothetical protein
VSCLASGAGALGSAAPRGALAADQGAAQGVRLALGPAGELSTCLRASSSPGFAAVLTAIDSCWLIRPVLLPRRAMQNRSRRVLSAAAAGARASAPAVCA